MIDIALHSVGAVILTICGFYAWRKLLNKRIDFSNYRIYFSSTLLIFISVINYNNVNAMIRIVFIVLIMSFIIKFVFNTSIKIAIVTTLYTQIINFISEFIYSISMIIIFNMETGSYSRIVVLFANIIIPISLVLIIKIPFVQRLYNNIIKVIDRLSLKAILFFLFPICLIANIYLAITYYNYDSIYYILINNVSMYLMIGIVVVLLKKEIDYSKIFDKYNTTLNSLKEYEDILDKYKVSNHENKNQLLTIRNMIGSKDRKVVKYIDELVDNKIKDNEKIMQESSIIPAGGLRGLIYSKILYMKENNIDYELNISKDIRTVDLINKLDSSDMLDICQVIGVYVDNASQAVINLEEKYVSIEMYIENQYLIFEISNFYEGNIEIDKFGKSRYTTKGNEHGYGLLLAKEIINKNKRLINELKITKNIFTQVLKIKMK